MRLLLMSLALGLVSLQCQAADAASPIPVNSVADFFRGPAFSYMVLNPAGNLVLTVTTDSTTQRQSVTLIDLQSDLSADIVTSAAASEYFNNLGWASDDTAYFDDNSPDGSQQLEFVKWGGIHDGKLQVNVVQTNVGAFTIVDRLMRDNKHMLVRRWEGAGDNQYMGVYRVDPIGGTGQMTTANRLMKLDKDTAFTMTDRNGSLRMFYTQTADGTRHYFLYAGPGQNGPIWHEFKVIKDERAVFMPIAFTSDDRHFYALSNLKRDTTALIEYDPASNNVIRTLFASNEGDVTGYQYDPYTDSIIYVIWNTGATPHYKVLDSRAGDYMPELRQAFPGKQIIPWYISRNGQEILVYAYSDTDPGAYYAVNTKRREAELLGMTRPWLDNREMSPVRAGLIKTKDGFSISYLLTLPINNHGPFPLIVIPHGGPIGIFDVETFDGETQLLASRGYAVLKVNYRGSGGSGRTFADAGKQQWGRKIEDDIQETVNKVLGTAPIDRSRICIYGASYGGYSALMSVIRNPSLYKCAASLAGVTDIPLMYNSSVVQFSDENRRVMADLIGDPTTEAVSLRAVSPVYLADKITRPVFLAQGGNDNRVDPEQAFRMKLVLEQLGKDVEFKYYPEDGHGFSNLVDEEDFYTRLLQFFDRNIGAKRDDGVTSKIKAFVQR